MSAPTFTPAPWHRTGQRAIVAGTGPAAVTVCEVFSGGVGIHQADANAALIAGAPLLHTAAAEVLAWIDAGVLTVGIATEDSPARMAACGRAVDALAHAVAACCTGEAP